MERKCENCFLFDEEKLDKEMNYIEDKHSLTLFLLNVILNIQEIWNEFCICDGENICLPCQANICYREYQYSVYKSCLNYDFLIQIKDNLYSNLIKRVPSYNHFLCKIINKKYKCEYKSWFSGETVEYDLDFCLKFYKEKKINGILNNDIKVIRLKMLLFRKMKYVHVLYPFEMQMKILFLLHRLWLKKEHYKICDCKLECGDCLARLEWTIDRLRNI